MKKYIILLGIIMLACNFRKQQTKPKEEKMTHADSLEYVYRKLKQVAFTYEPHHLSLSDDMDSLFTQSEIKYLNEIFKDTVRFNKDSLETWTTLILLKLYYYHLHRAHQGYNLINMRKGAAKEIIDYYLQVNHMDSLIKRGVCISHLPYMNEKRKLDLNRKIKVLIKKLDSLEEAIVEMYEEKRRRKN